MPIDPDARRSRRSVTLGLIPAGITLVLLLLGTSYICRNVSQQGERTANGLFHSDWDRKFSDTRHTFESTLNLTYDAIRTMAMLPCVRNFDPHTQKFSPDAQDTLQQVYNDVASHVQISEIDVVGADLDAAAPPSGPSQAPLVRFNRIILDQTDAISAVNASPGVAAQADVRRAIVEQIALFQKHFGDSSQVEGLAYPALTSSEVRTDDDGTSVGTKSTAVDGLGVVYSVPFYGSDGNLKGLVSAVLRTRALAGTLGTRFFVASRPAANYAVLAPDFAAELTPALPQLRQGNVPAGFAYSNSVSPDVTDCLPWQLTAAVPPSELAATPMFRESVARTRLILFGGIIGSLLLSVLVWSFCSTRNRAIELAEKMTAELGASERRFRTLVGNIPGAVFRMRLDHNHALDYISPTIEVISGLAPQVFTRPASRTLRSLVVPEDASLVASAERVALDADRPINIEYRILNAAGETRWLHEKGRVSAGFEPAAHYLEGIIFDITAQKLADEEREKMQRQVVALSRQAGMADVATGVLHNVGNVLNSVTVSTQAIRDKLQGSQLSNLGRAATMIEEHRDDLPTFLTGDDKGRRLPAFICKLSSTLNQEHEALCEEVVSLGKSIEHIQQIVASQQAYAKPAAAYESVDLREVLEDAVRINLPSFARHGVELVRHYQDVPPVVADKHLIMQILVNLVGNAKHAVNDSGRNDKHIILTLEATGSDDARRACIVIADNGIGIVPENLTKIFVHGFTTRKDGHGFGLHSSANAASQMHGTLTASSQGAGQGAEFRLELPVSVPPAASPDAAEIASTRGTL